ncbi:MAG: FAD-dependent oxidoreductase [Clostridia bacterium]|nr:FAD-dependent oxidoreductase [Clostridia bacterium]
MKKIVIVGGVAGGATAAARIRRLDESARIIVFERSGYVSYANCGLPYFIGGTIEDEEELTLQTPEGFFERFRIEAKVRHEVLSINREKKNVTVRDLEAGETFEESFDTLILSPGARPVVPPLEGVSDPLVFSLRTVEDTLKIHGFIEKNKPESAVIVGGGFIGVELAENLAELGMKVTMVDMQPQLMNQLDGDMAAFIHAKLRSKGIELLLERGVSAFKSSGKSIEVILGEGETVNADMAVLAIGVAPDTGLAKEAGLELGLRGSILVNERMQTSDQNIYAVGDAVQVKHFVTGEPALISLAGPANKQGRIAADNICGIESSFDGSQGSSVIKVFDMTAASTGINEKTAQSLGLNYDKVFLSPASHAGYYPGGKVMTMKVLFERGTDRLLGAQIVGFDGVDKRIDVIATAIRAGMKASELKRLDLAYAPPYSSAKDPVNMAGFMIENINKGVVKQFHWHEVASLPRDGSVILLDVRTEGEYARGHIDGFINIPVDELRERMGELEKGKKVYIMCQSALRSYIGYRILAQNGFDCSNLSGGYRLYQTVMQDKLAAEKAAHCGKEE